MKSFFNLTLLAFSLFFVACSETIYIDTHGERVTELERRADLNDQVNAVQDQLISLTQSSLILTNYRLDDLDYDLRQLIADEASAREQGDEDLADSLAAAVGAQTLVNLMVQWQLASISSKFPLINSKLNSLQSQMNNANNSISSIQDDIDSLNVALSDLDARLLAAEGDIDDLQLQIDQEGVKVYKCTASSSKERIFKINSKFYAVMNHVTKQTIQVLTGSTSQNVATPLLCTNNGNSLKLADNGGCGGGGWSLVPGTGVNVNVPSYSSANVSVVTGVQMALEPLTDGSYATTDGAAACTFSISNGGTTSTNLVQVQ